MNLHQAVVEGKMLVDEQDLQQYGSWLVSIWTDQTNYTCCHIWDSSISPIVYWNPGRLFLQAPAVIQVDHQNLNPLDCRRTNMRLATSMQNAQNRGITSRNTSGYKGVTLRKKTGLYEVAIRVNKVLIFLGSVLDPAVGGKMYDEAAKKYFGEFANLNFPEQS